MEDYRQKVLRGYLDKPDLYHIPPRQNLKTLRAVQSLLPSISQVEVHQHKHPGGNELAIVINGDNLWFCNTIELSIHGYEKKITISAQNVAQKQICYNHVLKDEINFNHEEFVKVQVSSEFSAPITTNVPMKYIVS